MSSKNTIFFALLAFLVTIEVLIALDYVWQEEGLRKERAAITDSILQMQTQIGYAGLIHNFKNYMLRPQEDEYRQLALKNYELALVSLEKLERFGEKWLDSSQMRDTRAMLEAYRVRLDELPGLLMLNLSLREIDQRIRYDDAPSHKEILSLSQGLGKALDARASKVLNRSLILGLLTLVALIISLSVFVRFFFRDQHTALARSEQASLEMEAHKREFIRSQRAMTSIMEDIQREKEQVSLLNEQLSKKNKEMEQFIYTVSHDLKSPLVTISGFSKSLAIELQSQLSEKHQHRLKRIQENVNDMESLLTDLLNLSRVVQQEVEKAQVDTDALVRKLCGSLDAVLADANAQVEILSPLKPLFANERLLSQCLVNLINNAVRYRDLERATLIEVYTVYTPSHTDICVKDNGIGIDKRYHELVFRIFEQLSAKEGTGVGLTIVKTIMEKHHGKVAVDSQLGAGSCFTLSFPNQSRKDVTQ